MKKIYNKNGSKAIASSFRTLGRRLASLLISNRFKYKFAKDLLFVLLLFCLFLLQKVYIRIGYKRLRNPPFVIEKRQVPTLKPNEKRISGECCSIIQNENLFLYSLQKTNANFFTNQILCKKILNPFFDAFKNFAIKKKTNSLLLISFHFSLLQNF